MHVLHPKLLIVINGKNKKHALILVQTCTVHQPPLQIILLGDHLHLHAIIPDDKLGGAC